MSRLASSPDSPAAPPVLEYGHAGDQPAPGAPPLAVRVGFLAVSLVAAVSPFLPFTFNTSPLDVVTGYRFPDRELLQIATPFFIALPMAGWTLRRVFRPGLRRGERLVMYAIGLAGASLTGAFVVSGVVEGGLRPLELALVLLGPAAIVIGLGTTLWLVRGRYLDDAATMALTTGYAANAVMVLAALYSPDHSGWWVTAVATGGIALEWVYLFVRSLRTRWGEGIRVVA